MTISVSANVFLTLASRKGVSQRARLMKREMPEENSKGVLPIESDLGSPMAVSTPDPLVVKDMPQDEYKVYKRRWLVLALFVLYSASNSMQWIQYSIIADVINRYYGVSFLTIDWTSMIYMITYIPLIFPASWILTKKGLRFTTLVGSLGTCVGAWIKVLSVAPDRFWVSFVGQTIVAVSQVFILSVPSRLAAVWFGPKQVSSACAIGVFGNQLGVATGFLLPPLLVKNQEAIENIGQDLSVMFYGVAIFTTILFAFLVIFFKAEPPTAPSAAMANRNNEGSEESPREFIQTLGRLFKNWGYILLLLSYGINVGVFYALSTLLNQVVLAHFEGAGSDAGNIGVSIVIAGMLGSLVCGIVLDKTHKFKETTLLVYVFSLLGMIVYSATLGAGHIAIVYVTAAALGFFMTGYLPVGFEFGAELTYPEAEGTSAGILNAFAQIFGVVFTIIYGQLFGEWGDISANIFACVALLIGVVLTALIKSDLRRQNATNARPTEAI
ncbi:heme transporter FLVCR1 isoform X2 [Neocloeon triangulifer]|uniref:heme transporter FLVCR1 isoform X2 n=1 Tax=Neocloeon triangulifer TaxID=2078957 RepID=UPI00286EECF6|nr:heme transporter FLVCR1 isoform X2 [Neocloeon triangulifer]